MTLTGLPARTSGRQTAPEKGRGRYDRHCPGRGLRTVLDLRAVHAVQTLLPSFEANLPACYARRLPIRLCVGAS